MKTLIIKKRLVKKSVQYNPHVGDMVIFKNHPYDNLPYEIKEVLPDGTIFMENSNGAYTGISPRTVTPLIEKTEQ